MNKNIYYIGAMLSGLATAVGVLQSILYLLVGGALFGLDAFMNWFWIAVVISFGVSLFLLTYYHLKKYTFTFWTAIPLTLATIFQQWLFYLILAGARDLQSYYITALFFVLVLSLIHALSFILSAASQKAWLKRIGFFLLVISSVMLILMIASIYTGDVSLKMKIQKGIEWTSLLANITPLMLMLNFLEEIKGARRENINIVNPVYITNVLGITCLIIFGLSFAFGLSIAGESSKHLNWQTKNAEETAKFVQLGEERSFTNAKGETLKYLLIKPKDYDSTKKYPLVVSLPYGGYEAPAAQLLADGSHAHRYPAFLFVPFCPQGAGWGGIPNYPTIDTLVFDAILKLEEEVSIDENRRYVTGISRGGYGSWHFISARPDMFAAAIPVCGGGNPQLASGIVDVSVWAFHGALDRNVPVSGSRDMIEAMKKAGRDPRYTEFSDKAHNIWYEVTQTPDLWDWLFEQERDPVTIAN